MDYNIVKESERYHTKNGIVIRASSRSNRNRDRKSRGTKKRNVKLMHSTPEGRHTGLPLQKMQNNRDGSFCLVILSKYLDYL